MGCLFPVNPFSILIISFNWVLYPAHHSSMIRRSFFARSPPKGSYGSYRLQCIPPDSMKTFSAKPKEARHDWYVVDATDKVLGRLAAEVAHRLRGKHKPEYTPHVDTGDYIVIINAEKVAITGNKANAKVYHHHTGHPGGLKTIAYRDMLERHPTRIIEKAIKGMLPKNKLGRAMFSKLRVYAGEEHAHVAQQPKLLEI